jgi:hypothetical protein
VRCNACDGGKLDLKNRLKLLLDSMMGNESDGVDRSNSFVPEGMKQRAMQEAAAGK